MRFPRPRLREVWVALKNDSQACCESAEKVWAVSNEPRDFSHFGPCVRMRFPQSRVREVCEALGLRSNARK